MGCGRGGEGENEEKGKGGKSLPQVAFINDKLALSWSTVGSAEAFGSQFNQTPDIRNH